jgi:hypothetical protein
LLLYQSGQSVIFHVKSSTKHIFTPMVALDSVTATVALHTIAIHEKISKNVASILPKNTTYKLDMKFVAWKTKLKA